jgi:hypothetical protein
MSTVNVSTLHVVWSYLIASYSTCRHARSVVSASDVLGSVVQISWRMFTTCGTHCAARE